MATYPSGVYDPRTKENKDGIIYDEAKTKVLFAEDLINLDDEVVAIEKELGTNPKGSFSDVKTRLESIKSIIFLGLTEYGIDFGNTKYFWTTRYAGNTLDYVKYPIPAAGKIKNLYVKPSWNDCNGSTTITLYKNGGATALTLTINSSSTALATDTTHEVSVSAGDYLVMKIEVGGTSGAIGIAGGSIEFIPS